MIRTSEYWMFLDSAVTSHDVFELQSDSYARVAGNTQTP